MFFMEVVLIDLQLEFGQADNIWSVYVQIEVNKMVAKLKCVLCLASSQLLSPDLAAAPGSRSSSDRSLVNWLWMRGCLLGSTT